MHLLRIAESTELNNAWIVGLVACCALTATWVVIALSIFLVRQAGRFVRVPAFRSVADAYARRSRLLGVIASFAIALAGAAVVAYTLLRPQALQPRIDGLLA
ncbi:MAG: hypothetical protein ABIY55_24175, partial [Kofleriaceae bacterium]